VQTHRNFAEAQLVEVIEKSPQRIEPLCPLAFRAGGTPHAAAGYCPGCAYQHMSYEEEIRVKQAQLANLLERMGNISPSIVRPARPSPAQLEYRNKIVLHGSVAAGQPVLGYFAEDNKTVIDVPRCLLAQPQLNETLAAIRKAPDFTTSIREGQRVTLRRTENDGVVWWRGGAGSGEQWLTETTLAGNLLVPRESFAQVNPPVALELVTRVIELVKMGRKDTVIDLYCGAGIFALAAARTGVARVFGIDSDPCAIRAAQRNANELRLNNAVFHVRAASEGLREVFRSVDAAGATVIVDPSRRGLEKDLVRLLVKMRPAVIIYVSCAADTMARDAAQLCEAGYKAVASEVMDMFPRTAFFESVTSFEFAGERGGPVVPESHV